MERERRDAVPSTLAHETPMGTHMGGHGMTNAEKRPKGHNADSYAYHSKDGHLARAERIHEMQKGKMSSHGVLVQASPEAQHVNLEAAYMAHHEGGNMSHVLQAMSTPHELQALHKDRGAEMGSQEIYKPNEVYNEMI